MNEKILCLFDVDGTLTKSRLSIEKEMFETLQKLKKKATVGLVGGSNLNKIIEQMNYYGAKDPKENVLNEWEFVFAENGLIAYKNGKLLNEESILKYLGEEKCQELINFSLEYLSKIIIPVKRGNFIEFRTGMINISPIGRSCSHQERLDFYEYDKQHKIREKLCKALTDKFGDKFNFQFSIGGQISIDAFPKGWDKTFCLRFVKDKFDKIYFFGDRTDPGGNDHEIYAHELVHGYKVENPEHTEKLLKSLFDLN